jgi:outer membrane protein TolC
VLTTRSDMQRFAADLATLDRQHRALTAHAKQLADARRAAEQAWRQGLLDWPTWLAIRSQSLTADLDLLAVQQQQATQSIALEALLGNTDFDVAIHPVPAQASTP